MPTPAAGMPLVCVLYANVSVRVGGSVHVNGSLSVDENANVNEVSSSNIGLSNDRMRLARNYSGPFKELVLKDLTEASEDVYSLIPSPATGEPGHLTKPRDFNLMFETSVGAISDESAVAYLRPETAQGIFTNFVNVQRTARMKVPFGIAQIGKAFRNEITPRNYIFRSREFEQMEIE